MSENIGTLIAPNFTNTTESVVVPAYYPFVMAYTRDGKQKWKLSFQSSPEQKTLFEGDTPTREEIFESLQFTALPIWMVPVFEVIVAHIARQVQPDVAAMVNSFLCWKLPKDFSPDAGISFNRTQMECLPDHCWPMGTNLLHAGQAKAMIEHILTASAPKVDVWNERY
jgi:hypothetical protein